ncbi:MAG: sensor histidine kinase [Gemmatimonadales bacterium]
MRFATRLVLGTLLVVVLTSTVLVWVSGWSLKRDLADDLRDGLGREAALVRAALPADPAAWPAFARRISGETGRRITLIDQSGVVVADSDVPVSELGTLENHSDRPEVAAALGGTTGAGQRHSETTGRDFVYVAVPGGPGVVRVAASLEMADVMLSRVQRSVAVAALIALMVGLLLAVLAGQSVARPLVAISSAARAIAAGTPPRFPHSRIPEIDALVRALRQMHVQLNERFVALRHEQEETAALVESMVEGVLASDARGRISLANSAALKLLGYGDDAELPELAQLFRAKPAREVVDEVLSGRSVMARETDVDGRTMLISARPLPTGGAVVVLHDLTEVRRLETVRRDFVANVSHELKTPLTSISGYAETLVAEQPDNETTRRFLQVIRDNAQRMQRLVDSLLDLSRIESGTWRPETEAADLGTVVREAWTGLAERAARRGVSLDPDLAPGAGMVRADPGALDQVLRNVLENALRYAPPGSAITLRSRARDDGVVISISDQGPGIPREHLPRIFERFYRADLARSRDDGGTGLGLAIVRHLVEAHGGWVDAHSVLGEGTTVSCWFPADAAV